MQFFKKFLKLSIKLSILVYASTIFTILPILKSLRLLLYSKKGFDAMAAARVYVTLMGRLGYSRFYVQGGDWGAAIATMMATAFPE